MLFHAFLSFFKNAFFSIDKNSISLYNENTYLLFEVIFVDAVKQMIKLAVSKVSGFLASCSKAELVILGAIVLIPVLAIILAIANRKTRRRRQNSYYVDRRASRPRRRRKNRHEDDYYLPRKHRVRYVKTMAPKVRKQRAKTKTLYCKLDQSTLLATGIFGVGLGMMIQKAALEEKKKLYW